MRPRVFIDLSVGDTVLGRIIFELFNDKTPKTCENFRVLATGERAPLHYKNAPIHRSIKGFMIQGGDFTKFDGTGGQSIYGAPFADEDLSTPIDKEGLLVMANRGPNTNSSQFFITLGPSPHLLGKHVVFGRVVKGYEIAEKIADLPTDEKDRPLENITISHCGELELRQPAATVNANAPSRKRSASASGSAASGSDSDGERRKKRHKKEKSKKKHKKRRRSEERDRDDDGDGDGDGQRSSKPTEPRQETEEEYDARLEREENERLREARLKALEDMRKESEAAKQKGGTGIRYKGRGQMKYIDPESRYRSGGSQH